MSFSYDPDPSGGAITVGTCSECGGPVVTPKVIVNNGTWPLAPTKTCAQCGATDEAPLHGPVIKMRKR